MPSSLSWIDYDSEAQQRAHRILNLFKERDTRDELGLGPIRDAISDTLFPGTSTIHTRLRYFLFIPWMYRTHEEKHTSSAKIRDYGRWDQIRLAARLKENCPGEYGIIGGEVGDKLKTLPSAIYWSALARWGLRLYPGTEGQYQRAVDEIYRRRKRARAGLASAIEDGDDIGGLWELGGYTFHPGLPEEPEGFPDTATFELTRGEARYLQERIRQSCSGSLMADLMADPVAVDADTPWRHPYLADFSRKHRTMLGHARLFSLVSHAAAILYNLLLAEIVDNDERVTELKEAGSAWAAETEALLPSLHEWQGSFHSFWAAVNDRGHEIGPRLMQFIESWLALVLQHRGGVFSDSQARRLVREREIEKKKANSRFTNARVRDQWGGRSGLSPMVYRWPIVQSYVNDMATALRYGP